MYAVVTIFSHVIKIIKVQRLMAMYMYERISVMQISGDNYIRIKVGI